MATIDYSIVVIYLIGLLACGAYLAKRASEGAESYFLGKRSLPWWALGASGMSSNLDAAGTMTIVTMLYLYGVHGFFIEMRGGVVLPIAVFLAFMGKWHQRSQVITTAEWMRLRFGEGFGGKASRFLAALTYVVITIGMVVFFLAAAGKFLAVFLPFSPDACATGMALIALIYTLLSGLHGVVWTDVFQGFIIAAAAIYVAVRASFVLDADLLAAWPAADLNTALPRVSDPALEPYELFLPLLLAWSAKGLLEGLGGSGGSAYMAQRFYAARSPSECQFIGMLWTFLFAFRWPMALGFAILGMHLGLGGQDPEKVLPQTLTSDFFPAGIRGLAVAALFAASMSTFDSTINAGSSYIVRDLLLPWKGKASEKWQVWAGYASSIFIVVTGLLISFAVAKSMVSVWVTIVIQLFPAFLIPFALRWFWGRFNGLGFVLGVVFGFAAAFGLTFLPTPTELGLIGPMAQPLNDPSTYSDSRSLGVLVQNGQFTDIFILSVVGLTSLVGCLLGTVAAPDTDTTTKKTFYDQVRPFGLWPNDWKIKDKTEHRGDMLRLVVALVWQVSTFLLPMLCVLRMWPQAIAVGVVFAITGLLLLRDSKSSGRDATLSV